MSDSQGSPEVDNDIDVPAVEDPHDSASEDSEGADNDEVTLDNKDVWDSLEKKTKAGAELAKKTGIEGWAKRTLQDQLVEKAMLIEEEMNKEGTDAYNIRYVWNEVLTPEGRSEFLKGNGLVMKVLTMLFTNLLPMVGMAFEGMHFINRTVNKHHPEKLSLKDFKPETIQIYCSLGLLECNEAEAKEVDQMAAKGLKLAANGAKVLKWASLLIPVAEELEPAFSTGEKGAKLLSKPAEWAGDLMPAVRSEVKRRSVEVDKARMEEHNKAGEDLGKEVPLTPKGPMDEAKKAA